MKLRWIIAAMTVAALLVLGAIGFVSFTVPINFTVTIPGNVQPSGSIRITSAEGGTVLDLHATGPVQRGDVLFLLDSDTEARRISDIDEQVALLEKRLEHEKKRLQSERDAWAVEGDLLAVRRKLTSNAIDVLTGSLADTDRQILVKLTTQADVEEKLAVSEHGILQELARELSVPAMELAQSQARTEKTKLILEQKRLEAERADRQREADEQKLHLELEQLDVESRQIQTRFQDDGILLQIEGQILQLKIEHRELTRTISRKKVTAPVNGFWGQTVFVPAEYISQGDYVGTLYNTEQLIFSGMAPDDRFTWMRLNQAARIRIDAFPFLKYGRLDAVVDKLEPLPDAKPPTFTAQMLIDTTVDQPFTPTVGQSGRADVVIFRGSLVKYLLAEPDDARTSPPEDFAPENLNLKSLFKFGRKPPQRDE